MLQVKTLGNGPAIVFLHGWAIHAAVWEPLLTEWEGRRLYLVDIPGYRGSSRCNPYSCERIAEILSTYFKGHSRLTVIGWSLGGMIALAWARDAPHQVARLCLISSTPSFVQRPDWPMGLTAETLVGFAEQMHTDYRGALSRFLVLQSLGERAAKQTLTMLREILFAQPQTSAETLRSGLALLSETDLRTEVRLIDQPSLVVSGGRDRLTPFQAGLWLAQNLAQAQHVLIEEAAHVPFLSHRRAFLQAVRPFIGNGQF